MLSSVSPIATGSNRFCAVEFRDSGAVSYLVVCVYMPAFVDSSSHMEYLNTVGELQGFIDAQQFDMLIIVGDCGFWLKQGPLVPLLLEFMSENCLVASDLSYRSYVGFTYECDNGSCRSWIDHILCSTRFSF